MRDATASLSRKLLLTGLLCLTGTSTVACQGLSNEALVEALKAGTKVEVLNTGTSHSADAVTRSSADDLTAIERLSQETVQEDATDSKTLKVIDKPLLFSQPLQAVKQLNLGNLGIHSSSAKINVKTTNESVVSVEYRLRSRKESEQNPLEGIARASDQEENSLAVALPNLPALLSAGNKPKWLRG